MVSPNSQVLWLSLPDGLAIKMQYSRKPPSTLGLLVPISSDIGLGSAQIQCGQAM